MIQYIRLKNFRCYTELDFDLRAKNDDPRKLVILYGENGSGKSNLITVFDFLYDTFHTMTVRKVLVSYLENQHSNGISRDNFKISDYSDTSRLIKQNKTIDSVDNMVIEIGFVLDGKRGSYLLECDSERIVHERLEYTLRRNRGVYYDISKDKVIINSVVFTDFKKDLLGYVAKFWGKHSVIALLNNALEEYSKDYIESRINPLLLNVLDDFNSINIYINNSSEKYGVIDGDWLLTPNKYCSGEIPVAKQDRLEETEKMIDLFFCSIYRNIERVFYKRDYLNDKVRYELYFVQLISGKERMVHYSDESSGTQSLLFLLPYCIAAVSGRTVLIDEIDSGIHDILLLNLLKSLNKELSGQLIVTTHNVLLLNEYEFKDAFFFIEVDEFGSRKINNPSNFGYRIQPGSNVVMNYLQGRFSGMPWDNMEIDFHKLSSVVHSKD